MKKFTTMLALLALVISLAACGASSDGETVKPDSSTPQHTGKPTTQATTTPTTETTVPPTTEPAFQEIVLVDDKNATVKVIGIEEDGTFGYTLKVFLENKTDMELMFTVENVSVNGFMVDPFWADTVDAGKKANEEISFSKKDFADNGIEAVEEITLTLRIYDNDNWLSDDIVKETITIKS